MNRKINHKKWSLHKKRLHRKRKSRRKRTFVPRIIVDTNVWYQLGKDDVLFNKVKDKLTPIYNNLWEMSNTGALYNKLDMVRNGIRKVMVCSKRMIITEPLKYLIKRANRKYRAKTRIYTEQMLLFLKNFFSQISPNSHQSQTTNPLLSSNTLCEKEMTVPSNTADTSIPRLISSSISALSKAARAEVKPRLPT